MADVTWTEDREWGPSKYIAMVPSDRLRTVLDWDCEANSRSAWRAGSWESARSPLARLRHPSSRARVPPAAAPPMPGPPESRYSASQGFLRYAVFVDAEQKIAYCCAA
jgi:hypothetical protein